jgi:hypothetical protein
LSNRFNSLELLWRQSILTPNCRQVDFLFGYRYCYFAEDLNINSRSDFLVAVPPIAAGTIQEISDRFSAKNNFQGGVLGVSTKRQYCRWSVEMLGKFALGGTRSAIDIHGNTILTVPPSNQTQSESGLLAQESNSGHFVKNNFTVIPELGLTLGYDLTDRLKASLGYTFLYWSRVARPTDQIDLNVNSDPALGGNTAPVFRYLPGDYWVQGLNFGLDYRF